MNKRVGDWRMRRYWILYPRLLVEGLTLTHWALVQFSNLALFVLALIPPGSVTALKVGSDCSGPFRSTNNLQILQSWFLVDFIRFGRSLSHHFQCCCRTICCPLQPPFHPPLHPSPFRILSFLHETFLFPQTTLITYMVITVNERMTILYTKAA